MASIYAGKRRPASRTAFGGTGIPRAMQERFEVSSGLSFDDVRIHYNSPRPAKLGALAYTQGTQVYVGPGQERHLEHELGHVLQQKRGIVKADGHLNGLPVNRDPGLERAADLGADQPIQAFGGLVGTAPIQMEGGEEEEEKQKGVGVEDFNFDIGNVPNMTKDEIIRSVPNDWRILGDPGGRFIHIKDKDIIRIRIDPPDRKTTYPHVHLYDREGSPLNVNGFVVGESSKEAHISYSVEGHDPEEQHGPAEEE